MTRENRSWGFKDTVTIASGEALSGAFEFSRGGEVVMPAAWTAASIGFYTSDEEDGTYQPKYDHEGNLIQIASPTAGNNYALPPALWGSLWVKLWSQDGAGSDTNQAAARSLVVVHRP